MGEHEKLPQPTRLDHAHLAAKAALSALPVIGGPAAELFAAIFPPPLARRRDRWLLTLAEGIAALESGIPGFEPQALANNDAFITAVLQVNRIALQTHQREKLNSLRNAVLNVALGRAPDQDQQTVFLAHLELMTPSHTSLMTFLKNPIRLAKSRGVDTIPHLGLDGQIVGLSHLFYKAFPELSEKRDFVEQVAQDLTLRGLARMEGGAALHGGRPVGLPVALTSLGEEFFAFIETPPELDR